MYDIYKYILICTIIIFLQLIQFIIHETSSIINKTIIIIL